MLFSRLLKKSALAALLLTLASIAPSMAQYLEPDSREPRIRAILYRKDNARALIYHDEQRFVVSDQTRLDDEWYVKEIKRESILFKRTSTHSFVELSLKTPQKARFHRDTSFYGHPIALWEALELLAGAFEYQAIMHFQAGGAVVPGDHGHSLSKLLQKVIPPHHRFTTDKNMVTVLPVYPSGEAWTEVIGRMKLCVPERLAIRYRGLDKPGIILSRGDDIQFILRKISLGGKVPIQFPRDLHFPVYASFRNLTFAQMLVKIVYLNQCIIIEREEGIEITPWPRQILQHRPYADFPALKAAPSEPQEGSGPMPPPIIWEHLLNHPVVQQPAQDY